MNISITPTIIKKSVLSISAFLFIALLLAVSLQSPTQALSIDPSKIINAIPTVTATVPIVKEVTPLLIPITTTAPQPQTTVTVPIQPIVVTPPQTTDPVATPTPTETNVPTESEDVSTSPAASNQFAQPFVFGGNSSTNGLSTLAKQAEFLKAPAHVPSPALTYKSREISPQLANALVYLGVIGVLVGGCVIFATQSKMRIS
jgi:hypothetical protein